MSETRALRVVTSPDRTVASVRSSIPVAVRAGAQVVEVRLDRLPVTEIGRLTDLFPSNVPLLATYRSKGEGGEGADEPALRASILDAAVALPFTYVDLEVERDPVTDRLRGDGGMSRRFVLSRHLDRIDLWDSARSLLSTVPPGAAWSKIVVPASVAELIHRILPALPPPGSGRFTVHTTGASGALLRLWADQLGLSAVYCAPPDLPDAGRGCPPVESAQIPVERLRVERIAPHGPFFGLLGSPTSHSRSPTIHERWMEVAHRPGAYVTVDILTATELQLAVPVLQRRGFRGLNVTSPWKEEALRLATTASGSALRTRNANTLVLEGTAVHADNTDRGAVLRRLGELRREGIWTDACVTVLGNGGAARSALDAARELRAERWVLGRDAERTGRVAREFGADLVDTAKAPTTSVILNATSVGREEVPRFDFDIRGLLGPGRHLVDFVYAPQFSTVRDLAEKAGASYEDGTRLLEYQAAESYRIWWGESPPRERSVVP
ncbi:MAG: type I 3-dehydroquinate dehydratase [Thermoplasmata archaeon]|nr:type I 3-dehydroquinate dehydratase [Thermoplasmata archaeon]